MADQLQQQLAQLLQLFQEERAANLARQEAINTRLDDLAKELSASKFSNDSTERGSHNRKGKEVAGGSATVPKFSKLDFPRFKGQEDPLGWLNRCEHFFRHQQTSEEDKVGLASYHLEGNAQLWFLQLEADIPQLSWEEFKQQCNLRFGPPIRSHKLGELAKLRQTGSVAAYQERFEQLASRAGTLSQPQKIELYISGLADYIAVEVELHDPPDLATAMSISRLYERKMQPFQSHSQESHKPEPADPPHQRSRFVKQLTRSEMEERRLKGLCFNCDEPFSRGHQCKRLFWIDLIEGDEEEYLKDQEVQVDQPEVP